MNSKDVAQGVAGWVQASCTPTINGAYPYLPSQKTQQLPDVVVEVAEKTIVIDDPRFPMRMIQQRWLRSWELGVSIMVDNTNPQAAGQLLLDYSDQLESALMEDGSLGDRVPFVSPFFTFDFTAPFVEYDDGTRGRELNLVMFVGELVEAPE